MSDDIETTGGLDRRDFIKRGAVVGGLVWAAPLVQSLGSPAFAQEGTLGGEEECDDFYNFKIDGVNESGGTPFFDECTIGVGDDCEPTVHWEDADQCVGQGGNWDPGTRTLSINFTHGLLSVTFGENFRSATITLPDNCELLAGDAKAGAEPSGGGCFPFEDDGTISDLPHAISHIIGTICCVTN